MHHFQRETRLAGESCSPIPSKPTPAQSSSCPDSLWTVQFEEKSQGDRWVQRAGGRLQARGPDQWWIWPGLGWEEYGDGEESHRGRDSANGGAGLGCAGGGGGTRKARELKEGCRVSPLSEDSICTRPTMILFFLPLLAFLRHILYIYPEMHCVAHAGLKLLVRPLPPAQVLDDKHALLQ